MTSVSLMGAFLSLSLLSGCEAPLNMEAVDAARELPIHRTDRYQAVARNDANVVIVGNQGVILYSSDKGTSWQRNEIPDWPALIDVAACPNGSFVALAFAPLVFVSSDNGATWVPRPIPTTESPQALTCSPDNKIWVVGAYTNRWTSSDAGESWVESTDDEDVLLTTVQFFDADNGVITGEFGTVMFTTDGGNSWNTMAPLVDEFYPQTTYFKNSSEGWVAGLGGVILYTNDGGQTWVSQDTETVVPLYGIAEIGRSMFAVGGEGTVLKYDGDLWRLFDHGKAIRLYIRAIAALDDARAIIAGVRGTLHIIDAEGV
ncbi:MAG TPA: glycosyl hydrolase [Gammaproteobacteria bacterium]|nr:glycosyl hydrolase [Gammaproteobacteria bacterium]|tara:strand:+ start:181 stop:1128 length:948 start_codon:yes stop_codon:yes gene_type:complete